MNWLRFKLPFPVFFGIRVFLIMSLVFVGLFFLHSLNEPERRGEIALILIWFDIAGSLVTILLGYLIAGFAHLTGYRVFRRVFHDNVVDEVELKLLRALKELGIKVVYQNRNEGFQAISTTLKKEAQILINEKFPFLVTYRKNRLKNEAVLTVEIKAIVLADTGETRYVFDWGREILTIAGIEAVD